MNHIKIACSVVQLLASFSFLLTGLYPLRVSKSVQKRRQNTYKKEAKNVPSYPSLVSMSALREGTPQVIQFPGLHQRLSICMK